MATLDSFFKQIETALKSSKFTNTDGAIFRGHSNKNYKLVPTLQRDYKKTNMSLETLENNLYNDFRSLVGPRTNFANSWDALFVMRHEGVPTRLLDWTENLGTALFFALDATNLDEPHIWILNPYVLNKKHKSIGESLIVPDEDFPLQYHETYVAYCFDKKIKIPNLPIAILPRRSNDRIFAQRGLFTIHGKSEKALEEQYSDCVQKIEIPNNIIPALRNLLNNFGINKYSVYPDLKGLSDHLRGKYNY